MKILLPDMYLFGISNRRKKVLLPVFVKLPWGTPAERQRRLRIKLAVYAYAYECESVSLISDHAFDRMCLEVDPSISTGHSELDTFFRDVFTPHTGSWIYDHPELEHVKQLYFDRYAKD